MRVVVVPAFTQRQQGQPEVIPAVVGGVITAATPAMRQGVDSECSVVKHHRGYKESPHEHLWTIGAQLWRKAFQGDTRHQQGKRE